MEIFGNWFDSTIKKVNFEDIIQAIKKPEKYLIINTLPIPEQDCLIKNTIYYDTEEKIINDLLSSYEINGKRILIYGKNSSDSTSEKKYRQLRSLGFSEVYVYVGGLFEWLLLQDIYGAAEFPTTKKTADLLKYKPVSSF